MPRKPKSTPTPAPIARPELRPENRGVPLVVDAPTELPPVTWGPYPGRVELAPPAIPSPAEVQRYGSPQLTICKFCKQQLKGSQFFCPRCFPDGRHYAGPASVQNPDDILVPNVPPQPLPAMPLYQIDRELMELVALREELEDSAPTRVCHPADFADLWEQHEDTCKTVESRIAQYMTAAREKTDAIAYTIRHLNTNADLETQESARHAKRASMWKAQATRLKDYVLRFMTQCDPPITRMETPANRLRVQGNGGMQPLDVYGTSLLPLEYVRWTFTVNGPQLARLREMALITEDEELGAILFRIGTPTPDTDAIRAALSQHVLCPVCNGVLDIINGYKCAGRGTVSREIPGARLLDRGKQLRVE